MNPPETAPSVDYLAIGHVARDLTPDGPRLGGTAAYAALTARALGLRAAILTSAAPDLDLSPLQGMPLRCLRAPATTTFENIYQGEGRTQILSARAIDLTFEELPAAWSEAPIVHLGPVAGEVPLAWASSFPSTGFVGVTAQGWLREWDSQGRVRQHPWEAAQEGLAAADAVIVSLEDLGREEKTAHELAGVCRLLVVTDGARGARVYWNGDVRRIPVAPAPAVDPTGAGDVFAAAFFIRLRATRDPWEAARFAHILAAASLGRPGLAGVPTPEDVLRADLQVVR